MNSELSKWLGRKIVGREIPDKLKVKYRMHAHSRPALVQEAGGWRCGRCQEWHAQAPHLRYQPTDNVLVYCPSCLQFGRLRSDDQLIFLPLGGMSSRTHGFTCTWSGQLSAQQALVSEQLMAQWQNKDDFLVWAVTGAGKTEMLFGLIEKVLKEGGTVGIAAPRIDVCLELFPRLQAAFADTPIRLLYGEQEEEYDFAPLIICTTHQLIKFHHFFSCLIIDEVDSFPYVGNRLLATAARTACHPKGKQLYLTATPDATLQERIQSGKLPHIKVPTRFHQKPLIVPSFKFCSRLNELVSRGKIPQEISVFLQRQVKRRMLLFVPAIEWLDRLLETMKARYPNRQIAAVHANHPERETLILRMREKQIDWLLTTTILERGVTFHDIDVCVLDASHPQFKTPVLVQIAGRVGRHPDASGGLVLFFHEGVNRPMMEARNQIQEMNQLAQS